MQRIRIAGVVLIVAMLAVACQKQTGGPSVDDYQKQRAAIIEKQRQGNGSPTQVAGTQPADPGDGAGEDGFAANGRGYVYDPLGKRDPFRSFILDRVTERDADAKGPLEQFDLSQLSVTGVVWETNNRRALVLDPSGRNYIVQEGDPIGKNDGRVISITDASVTVREAYVDFHGDRTTKEIEMSVRQSQGG